MKYPHLAAQLFDVPLLARPETAEVFAQAFVQILAGQVNVTTPEPREAAPAREAFAGNVPGKRSEDRSYIVTPGGIGVLPIYGALAQRAGEIQPDCTEMTSYQRLSRSIEAMLADPAVRGILLEIDSPGGQVAGNFELARRITAARAVKPVYAHANELALSGGYSIAAAAEKLYVPDTGLVGSIGVIMLHMSQAERDAKLGYQYTAIYAGARKNDMNPHFKLSDDARARLQAMVDSNYETFVAHVAAARGVDASVVRGTEAGVLQPQEALDARLVDGITTFEEALAALESRVKGVVVIPGAGLAAHHQPQEKAMSEQGKPAATEHQQPAENHQPAQVDAGKVAADARKAERERVNGILNCEEAKGRPTLAQHLASDTDMSVDEAKKLLAKSPIERAAAGRSEFARAMDTLPNPKIGTEDSANGADSPEALARQIAAHVNPKLK